MNIVQAHKYFWHRDGASNYALFLSEELQKKGHTVIPFSMHHPSALPSPYSPYFVSEMDISDPQKVSFRKKIQSVGRMLYSLEAKRNMERLLSEHQVDVVHLHNIYHHISPSILPVIKKRNIPIIMTLHDYKLISPNYTMFHHGEIHEEDAVGWYGTCVKNKCMKDSRIQSRVVRAEMIFHHKIMKYYERYVDQFIAPSQFILDICVKHGWNKNRFIHIPHPIDTTHVTPPTKKDGGFVAYVGRLSEEKGLHVLLDAAKKTPDISYKIVGTGPELLGITKRIHTEKISNVRCTGFQTGESLQKLLEEARLFVVPSLWYENYPLSILEPKALGKIVIGSRIGGIPELLPKELLVKPNDAKSLAQAIETWYYAPLQIRKKMSSTLRKQVEVNNDVETHIRRIEESYNNMQICG
ncbi:MAG: glycosyltransferase family 4 protein [Candidatus Magasanikbacteria bacterium]|nr:glycosyltransferase family 4 protein [Candidatus Magasanikbacteria bacterium]